MIEIHPVLKNIFKKWVMVLSDMILPTFSHNTHLIKLSKVPMEVLMCGMNSQGAQQHAGIFILRNTSLKMAV